MDEPRRHSNHANKLRTILKKQRENTTQHRGGVPEFDTPEASPHALPIAPTRANWKMHHLRAILWGLGRVFRSNPNTFYLQL